MATGDKPVRAAPESRRGWLVVVAAGLAIFLAVAALSRHTVLVTREPDGEIHSDSRGAETVLSLGSEGQTDVVAEVFPSPAGAGGGHLIRISVSDADPRLYGIDVRLRTGSFGVPTSSVSLEPPSGEWPLRFHATEGDVRLAAEGLNEAGTMLLEFRVDGDPDDGEPDEDSDPIGDAEPSQAPMEAPGRPQAPEHPELPEPSGHPVHPKPELRQPRDGLPADAQTLRTEGLGAEVTVDQRAPVSLQSWQTTHLFRLPLDEEESGDGH